MSETEDAHVGADENFDHFIAALEAFDEKYGRLVWFARKSPADARMEGVRQEVESVLADYPEEATSLQSEEIGDWQHGFNNGMLAAVRFVLTALGDSVDEAHDLFPELDT